MKTTFYICSVVLFASLINTSCVTPHLDKARLNGGYELPHKLPALKPTSGRTLTINDKSYYLPTPGPNKMPLIGNVNGVFVSYQLEKSLFENSRDGEFQGYYSVSVYESKRKKTIGGKLLLAWHIPTFWLTTLFGIPANLNKYPCDVKLQIYDAKYNLIAEYSERAMSDIKRTAFYHGYEASDAYAMGRFDASMKAIENIKKRVEKDQDSIAVLLERSVASLNQMRQQSQEHASHNKFDEVKILVSENQEDKALKLLEENRKVYPYSLNDIIFRGKLLLEKGRIPEALEDFKLAMLLNSSNQVEKRINYHLSDYYYSQVEDYSSATAFLSTLTQDAKYREFALFRRSICYENLGALSNAITDMSALVREKPSNEDYTDRLDALNEQWQIIQQQKAQAAAELRAAQIAAMQQFGQAVGQLGTAIQNYKKSKK